MGNLDSKLSQPHSSHNQYSIIDEPAATTPNGTTTQATTTKAGGGGGASFDQNVGFRLAPPLWHVKRANFHNENKNALLFEFNYAKYGSNDAKKSTNKHLKMAQNQIKVRFALCKYILKKEKQFLN